MVSLAEGVTLAQELVTFVPELVEKLVAWQGQLPTTPETLADLLSDISNAQKVLSPMESKVPVGSGNTSEIALTRLSRIHETLQRLYESCLKVQNKSGKKMSKLYPTLIKTKLEDIESKLAATISLLNEYMYSSGGPSREPGSSQTHQRKFVCNVDPNPYGVFLDFDSVDADGLHVSSEGKLKALILSESQPTSVPAVAAKGMGGVGKTCAIRAIGLMEETRARFPGGILFFTIGAEAGLPRLIDGIARMVRLAGGEKEAEKISTERGLDTAVALARDWFQHRAFLFIFDDIWCVKGINRNIIDQLANLAAPQSKSKVAYTTRDMALKCKNQVIFDIKETEGSEAEQILLSWSGNLPLPIMPPALAAFKKILKSCNGLPLTLAICGRGVRYNADHLRSKKEHAWLMYQRDLHRPSGNIDSDFTDMEKTVFVSLRLAEVNQWYFESLCIIRKQQSVPLRVISRLWSLPESKTKDIIKLMNRFCIIQMSPNWEDAQQELSISMHDLILEYARRLAEAEGHSNKWSRKVLTSYIRKNDIPSGNVTLPFGADLLLTIADDKFILKNLFWLLTSAHLHEDIISLSINPLWVVKQCRSNDIGQVIADLQDAVDHLGGDAIVMSGVVEFDVLPCLKGILQAVHLAAAYIKDSTWNGMVWFQLYARMIGLSSRNAVAKQFVDLIERAAEKPWLMPSEGCLPAAGTPLQHIIRCEGSVHCIQEVGDEVKMCFSNDDGLFESTYNLHNRTYGEDKYFLKSDGNKFLVTCAAFFNQGSGIVFARSIRNVATTSTLTETGEERLERGKSGRWWSPLLKCYSADNSSEHSSGDVVVEAASRYVFQIVTVSASGTTIVCEDSGRELDTVATSNDGRLIVSLSDEWIATVWENRDGRWVNKELKVSIYSLAVSSDGKRFVSASSDHIVRVWEKRDDGWKYDELRGHTGMVLCVAFSNDGTQIVSGSADKTVRVWQMTTDTTFRGWQKLANYWECAVLRGCSDGVNCVAVSNDGMRIVAGSLMNAVRMWKKRQHVWEVRKMSEYTGWMKFLVMSSNGERVFCGNFASSVHVLQLQGERSAIEDLDGHTKDVLDVSVSRDGRQVVSGSMDGTVRLWDMQDGRWVSEEVSADDSYVWNVAVADNGASVVSAGTTTTRVSHKRSGRWVHDDLCSHTDGRILCVAISRDGSRVVCGCSDTVVRVWKQNNGKWECTELRGHTDYVSCVVVSAGGFQVASGSEDTTVRVWNNACGKWTSQELSGEHNAQVDCVDLSDDGSRVVSASKGKIRVWEFNGTMWETQKLLHSEKYVKLQTFFISGGDGIHCLCRTQPWLQWRKVKGEWVPEEFDWTSFDFFDNQVHNQELFRVSIQEVSKLVGDGIHKMAYAYNAIFFRVEAAPYLAHVDFVGE